MHNRISLIRFHEEWYVPNGGIIAVGHQAADDTIFPGIVAQLMESIQ